MARSLKTKYLLLALVVGAVLSLLLGGLSYYEHRVDAADVNQLTYSTVAQRLEADLETRASSLSEITGTSLGPALSSGNKAAVTSIAERLLDERDIERVEVLDAHGAVLFRGGDPAAQQSDDWFAFQSTIHSNLVSAPVQRVGTLRIWMSRGEMRETLASIRKQLESQQGMQIKRMRGLLAGITLPLLVLGLAGAWFIARQLARPDLRAGQERRSDRPRRLHPAPRRGAPGRARRPAIRARAHAAEAERNHHHQELSEHGAQQPERCRAS